VQVADQRYTSRHVLVATGSWPWLPQIHGIEHVITSNEALEVAVLPRRLVIVGAGYIGVELAAIFAAVGVEVTVVARSDGPLRGFDRDVRTTLRAEMEKRGVRFVCGATVDGIDQLGEGFVVHLADRPAMDTDLVLYASGRRPNTRDIGLEEVGVQLRDKGAIAVDEWSRTAVESIYAIGDVTDRVNLTPLAIAEGRAVVETLFNENPTRFDHEMLPTGVFSQPPVGVVGWTEQEARARHAHVDVYRTDFRPLKHALSGRDARSMMKLVVDRETDRVLGCHMVGEDAAEIIQGFALALRCGATKQQVDAATGIHPTAAEEFMGMYEPIRGESEA
jgi:glutathione reductase (NADPH)